MARRLLDYVAAAVVLVLTARCTTLAAPVVKQVTLYNGYYAIDGVTQPQLTLSRGTVYQFEVTSPAIHPFYITTAMAGCSSSARYSPTGPELCSCPSNAAGPQTTVQPGGVAGVLQFAPGDDTPSVLYYGCVVHCNLGARINIVGSGASAGACCNCGGDPSSCGDGSGGSGSNGTSIAVDTGLSAEVDELLTTIHGFCMFTAFGVLFPVGGFLAYLGYHRQHIACQSCGLVVALAGACLSIVFTTAGHRKVDNIHGVVGIALLVMTIIIQPVAIRLSWAPTHRRNGAAIALIGLSNCFLGLLRIGAQFALQLSYALWAFVILAVFVFWRPAPKFQRAAGEAGQTPMRPALEALTKQQRQQGAADKTLTKAVAAGVATGSSTPPVEATGQGAKPEEGAATPPSAVKTEVPVAVVCTDGKGHLVSMSKAAEELLGWREAELMGKGVEVLMEERYRMPHRLGLQKAAKKRKPDAGHIMRYRKIYAVKALHKDGYAVPVEIRVSSFLLAGKLHFTALFTPVAPQVPASSSSGFASTGAPSAGGLELVPLGCGVGNKAQETRAGAAVDATSSAGAGAGAGAGTGAGASAGAGAGETTAAAGSVSSEAAANARAQAVCDHILRRHLLAEGEEDGVKLTDESGRVTEDLLQGVLEANLKRNKLEFSEEDTALIVRSIVEKADTSGRKDGTITLHELSTLLEQYGLTLGSTGVIKGSGNARKQAREAAAALGHADSNTGDPPSSSALQRCGLRAADNMPRILLLGIYIVANVAIFLWRYGQFAGWYDGKLPPNAAVPWARGAGMVLNLNCALIVVPMCRQFLSWARTTAMVHIFPFDEMREAHMLIGYVICAATIVHVGAHYGNYAQSSMEAAVTTDAGVTGHIITLILLIIVITALPAIRRAKLFHIFISAHHLFILFFVLLFMHGFGWWNPNFWKFAIVPLLLYVAERARRMSDIRKGRMLRVIRARKLAGKVTEIRIEKPKDFVYVAGNYIFIIIPSISRFEAHPFTLTSAPDEPYLSLHIRAVGDWTRECHKHVARIAKEHVYVDGPYGSSAQEIFDSRTVLLVGAGIGVTPYASVLKNIRARLTHKSGCVTEECGCKCACCRFKLKKAYFVWTTRDQLAVEWFGDLLRDLRTGDSLDIKTFLTGRNMARHDLGAVLLHAGLDIVREATGRDLVTGHNAGTAFERPDWDRIFRQLSAEHSGEEVGVFFCGPAGLAAILRRYCEQYSNAATNTTFKFRKEVF